MNTRETTAIAIKLLAIWLLVNVVLNVPNLLLIFNTVASYKQEEISKDLYISVVLSSLVIGIIASFLLFRSRDPKFDKQKEKHKRPTRAKPDASHVIPASEFNFDPITLSCKYPAGKTLHADGTRKDKQGNLRAFFRGRLKHCRDCDIKHKCMRNPKSAEHSNGYGRQVSFLVDKTKDATYTDWMKKRVDSKKGKQIYSHRMSVVEPVFGNITSNKKLKRFSLRSKIKVNTQWTMFCLIQNIEKLANYG